MNNTLANLKIRSKIPNYPFNLLKSIPAFNYFRKFNYSLTCFFLLYGVDLKTPSIHVFMSNCSFIPFIKDFNMHKRHLVTLRKGSTVYLDNLKQPLGLLVYMGNSIL